MIATDSTIEFAEIGTDTTVGMHEAYAAWHDHGDLSPGFSGAKDGQSPPDAGGTLTNALQAMMAFSPIHGIAWVDANPIVLYTQHQIIGIGQVDSQRTGVGVCFCILNRFVSNSI